MKRKITKKEVDSILNKNRFINSENELRRLPMQKEYDFLEKIRQGKYHEVTFSAFNTLESYMGISTKDRKKFFHITVATITLATRAARGGLRPDDSYDISEAMLQLLEKATTIEEMQDVIQLTSVTFARCVHESKQEQKLYIIEKTRVYINRNITKKIYLDEIADYVGVNPTYLSRVFSHKEGMSIQEYIQQEKVTMASNLLIFTNFSVAEISQYVGYQSQSNFSSVFKKWKGIPPSDYRKQNKKINYTMPTYDD